MSYQGYDKWDVYGGEISEDAPTLKELKEIIKKHIKSFCISKAYTSNLIHDYEITKISITIKRKMKNEK